MSASSFPVRHVGTRAPRQEPPAPPAPPPAPAPGEERRGRRRQRIGDRLRNKPFTDYDYFMLTGRYRTPPKRKRQADPEQPRTSFRERMGLPPSGQLPLPEGDQ